MEITTPTPTPTTTTKAPIRQNKTNAVTRLGLDLTNRLCVHCHCKLVETVTPKYNKTIFKCPTCGVFASIQDTEPEEALKTNFPTTIDPKTGASTLGTHKHVVQPPNENLPRSRYFELKTFAEKHKAEMEDPFLRDFLRKRNDLTITNIDYHDPTETGDVYY